MVFGLSRRPRAEPAAAAVPAGVRVYAIGDIHGRADLLDRLLARIVEDGRSADGSVRHIVFLGDYIDRGPDTAAVLDRLADGPPPGYGAVYLKGNHEAALLRFLTDTAIGPAWLEFGGLATLASYGVAVPDGVEPGERLAGLQERLREALPARHLRFLRDLRSTLTVGDYFFVHAGVRPGVPVEEQSLSDLLWIREPFLSSRTDFGKVVVHGHTIGVEPQVRANRIGIDTGAYATHRLTCLVLEGCERRFLCTA